MRLDILSLTCSIFLKLNSRRPEFTGEVEGKPPFEVLARLLVAVGFSVVQLDKKTKETKGISTVISLGSFIFYST